MSFTDRDLGYRAFLDALDELADRPGILVGLRASTAGSEVVEYATRNEFGFGVPERSFLRSTVDANQEDYLDQLGEATREYVYFRPHAGEARLDRLGFQAVADVQKTIVDLKEPPNSPATIAAKGSSNPLIDTGRMRQSIDFVRVEGDE